MPLANRWMLYQANSVYVLPKLADTDYDLALQNGSHEKDVLETDIRNIVPKMTKNILLLIHDAEHPDINYGFGEALSTGLEEIKYSRVTLPNGYGLIIVGIEEGFGNGEVAIRWREQ